MNTYSGKRIRLSIEGEDDCAHISTSTALIETEKPSETVRCVTETPKVLPDDLPNEVLSEIFAYTHAAHELNTSARHPLNPHAQARMLRNVSKRWKGIAERTISMWQDFEIDPSGVPSWASPNHPGKSSAKEKQAQKMMELWLSFAFSPDNGFGKLNFVFRTYSTDTWTKVEKEVLRALKKVSDSWHYVHLEMNKSLIPELRPIQGKLGNLEWLGFVLHSEPEALLPSRRFGNVTPQEFILRVFSNAPKLRTLSTRGVVPLGPTESDDWIYSFPWEQLDRVEITEDRSWAESYNLLSRVAESAKTIQINSNDREHFRGAIPILTLPAARCLMYVDCNTQDIGNSILNHLDLPNLTELSIDDASGRFEDFNTLSVLLASCSPRLTLLELRCHGRPICVWPRFLVPRVEESLIRLSMKLIGIGIDVEERDGRLVIVDDLIQKLAEWIHLTLRNLRDLVVILDIDNDTSMEILTACIVELRNVLQAGFGPGRTREQRFDIMIVVKGNSTLVADTLRGAWRNISRMYQVDEERVIILED
ncbi:hypothetical protein PM082_009872 [Marasmius tenuissimus]|nr:hypothetical protein PM082_009872 [Marasmius tenuissimus]